MEAPPQIRFASFYIVLGIPLRGFPENVEVPPSENPRVRMLKLGQLSAGDQVSCGRHSVLASSNLHELSSLSPTYIGISCWLSLYT